MDMRMLQRLRDAFAALAARVQTASPAGAALASGLGGTAPDGNGLLLDAVADVFDRYYRIISDERPAAELFLCALHHLALTGDAPHLAPYLPTCGGSFTTAEALPAAAADVAAHREDLLDYLLSQELQPHLVERSAAYLLGAATAADRFGGGVSLVDVGCGGGLNLLFDGYAYRFGTMAVGGDSPVVIAVDYEGAAAPLRYLEAHGIPPVVGRYGLDPALRDLADPADLAVLTSFLWPDQAAQAARLRSAAALLAAGPRPDLRQGAAEADLLPLLAEAYDTMPEGNTLLVADAFLWPYLSETQRQQMTWAIQRLAGHLQPHKPMAWLQLEPQETGRVELKLHTFGWADKEDRAVRRLAAAEPDLSRLRWLE
jgi:hypothetical protein